MIEPQLAPWDVSQYIESVQDTYIAETSLPRGRDLVIAILGEVAELSVELRKGIYNCEQRNTKEPRLLTKVVDETNIVAFHNNTSGNKQTPRNSLGIQLDALQEGHLLFLLSSRTCMFDNRNMCLALTVKANRGIGRRDLLFVVCHGEQACTVNQSMQPGERGKHGAPGLLTWGKLEKMCVGLMD